MSDRLDELGWADPPERGRWHGAVGNLLCVGTGVTLASLWAASCVACFFLPNGRADALGDSTLGLGASPEVR